jgi:hypothetical protein
MSSIKKYVLAFITPAATIIGSAASQHTFASVQDLGVAFAVGLFAAIMLWCDTPDTSPPTP